MIRLAILLLVFLTSCVSEEQLQARRDAEQEQAKAKAQTDHAQYEQWLAMDDQTCRSYGLTPGPDGRYADCRTTQMKLRIPAYMGLGLPAPIYVSPPLPFGTPQLYPFTPFGQFGERRFEQPRPFGQFGDSGERFGGPFGGRGGD